MADAVAERVKQVLSMAEAAPVFEATDSYAKHWRHLAQLGANVLGSMRQAQPTTPKGA